MNREQLIKKNMGTLAKMNEMSGLNEDTNVLIDKLIYMNNKYHGRPVAGDDEYPVPEDFSYEEFDKDYLTVVNPAE